MNIYLEIAEFFSSILGYGSEENLAWRVKQAEKAKKDSETHGDIEKIIPGPYGIRTRDNFPDQESWEAYVDAGLKSSVGFEFEAKKPDRHEVAEGSVVDRRRQWGKAVALADLGFHKTETNMYAKQGQIFQAQFRALKDTDLLEAGRLFEKVNRAYDVAKEHGDVSKIVPVFYGARDQADFPDLESHEAYLDYGKAFPDEFHYKEGSIHALRWAWGRAVAAADMAFPDPTCFNKDKDFIVFVTTGGAAGADDFVLQARRNGEELPSGSTVVGVYDPEDGLLSLFITSLLVGDGTADAPAGKQSYVRAWNDMKEYVRKGMLPPSPKKKKKIVVRRFRKVPDDMRLRLALEEAVNRADGTVLDQAKEKSEECPFCHSSSGFSLQEDHGNDWPRCNNCGAC